MLKTHFSDGNDTAVCGRPAKRLTDRVRNADCGSCQNTPEYARALGKYHADLEAEFAAQTPRKVPSMWTPGSFYTCPKCQGDLFRERPRSLHSFHFVCEGCGYSIHPLTETGMSS